MQSAELGKIDVDCATTKREIIWVDFGKPDASNTGRVYAASQPLICANQRQFFTEKRELNAKARMRRKTIINTRQTVDMRSKTIGGMERSRARLSARDKRVEYTQDIAR